MISEHFPDCILRPRVQPVPSAWPTDGSVTKVQLEKPFLPAPSAATGSTHSTLTYVLEPGIAQEAASPPSTSYWVDTRETYDNCPTFSQPRQF